MNVEQKDNAACALPLERRVRLVFIGGNMNRMKRDYCSKGKHPHWRAWIAKYDMTDIAWPWLGEFCTCCGERIVDTVGSGPPKPEKESVLRMRDRIDELRRKIRARKCVE